jgi:hypothetical protein
MRHAEVSIAGTALIVGEARDHSGEQGCEFLAVTAGVTAVTIVDVRRTAVLLTARAAVGLFAGRTKMMLHAISPGGRCGAAPRSVAGASAAETATITIVTSWHAGR